MKLITRFELAALSPEQLRGLYREVFREAVRAPRHSADRRNALASLDNIEVELACRRAS